MSRHWIWRDSFPSLILYQHMKFAMSPFCQSSLIIVSHSHGRWVWKHISLIWPVLVILCSCCLEEFAVSVPQADSTCHLPHSPLDAAFYSSCLTSLVMLWSLFCLLVGSYLLSLSWKSFNLVGFSHISRGKPLTSLLNVYLQHQVSATVQALW